METINGSGKKIAGLILFMTIVLIVMTGCTDSAMEQQGPATPVHEKQGENPAVTTNAAITTPEAPAQKPVSSTGVINIDPVTDKTTGDTFTLTGTTSLPAGTEILWQVMPDTGSPPTGLDMDSTMSVGGNVLVTQGDGTSNRIAIPVDLGRLVQGKYTVVAGKAKEHLPDKMVFEIGNDFGYAFLRIK